jgi:hypothetical protein
VVLAKYVEHAYGGDKLKGKRVLETGAGKSRRAVWLGCCLLRRLLLLTPSLPTHTPMHMHPCMHALTCFPPKSKLTNPTPSTINHARTAHPPPPKKRHGPSGPGVRGAGGGGGGADGLAVRPREFGGKRQEERGGCSWEEGERRRGRRKCCVCFAGSCHSFIRVAS